MEVTTDVIALIVVGNYYRIDKDSAAWVQKPGIIRDVHSSLISTYTYLHWIGPDYLILFTKRELQG